MNDDEFCTDEACVCGLCGECDCGYDHHICAECDFEIKVSMFLFDVIEKLVARYRKGDRSYARALAVSRASQPEVAARAAVTFDLLWPKEEAS